MMTRNLVLLLVLAGCTDPAQGTIVGNPGLDVLRLASGLDVRTDAAEVAVDQIVLRDCEGVATAVQVGATLDLVDGDGFDAPDGTFCEVEVRFAGDLTAQGVTTNGTASPVSLTLELQSAIMTGTAFTVGEDPLVIELAYPQWFAVAELVEGADGYEVGPGDPSHAGLVDRLVTGSAVFEDADANGTVSETERSENELAKGVRRPGGGR